MICIEYDSLELGKCHQKAALAVSGKPTEFQPESANSLPKKFYVLEFEADLWKTSSQQIKTLIFGDVMPSWSGSSYFMWSAKK